VELVPFPVVFVCQVFVLGKTNEGEVLNDFTPFQEEKLDQLREELRLSRPEVALQFQKTGRSIDGYAFTEVAGTTVVIIARKTSKPWGGYKLPSVMTYPEQGARPNTSLDAASWADLWFRKQSKENVRERGHFGSIVSVEWRCNDSNCPCQEELDSRRRKDRSLSGNRQA
jgi:hypothetical protein